MSDVDIPDHLVFAEPCEEAAIALMLYGNVWIGEAHIRYDAESTDVGAESVRAVQRAIATHPDSANFAVVGEALMAIGRDLAVAEGFAPEASGLARPARGSLTAQVVRDPPTLLASPEYMREKILGGFQHVPAPLITDSLAGPAPKRTIDPKKRKRLRKMRQASKRANR